MAAARAALAEAKEMAPGLRRARSVTLRIFDLGVRGPRPRPRRRRTTAHLSAWPRDALVVASAANPKGLIGASGRIGQKHQIAAMMDSLAPHYDDDFWFLSYHAMALSEDRQLARRSRRSNNPWRRTRTTRMARMASPMFVTRAASADTARSLSAPPGLPLIHAMVFSMVI